MSDSTLLLLGQIFAVYCIGKVIFELGKQRGSE